LNGGDAKKRLPRFKLTLKPQGQSFEKADLPHIRPQMVQVRDVHRKNLRALR